MPALIHRKLLRHGFAELALGLESNEIAAAHHALQWARPGEVLALPVHGAGTRGALLVGLGPAVGDDACVA